MGVFMVFRAGVKRQLGTIFGLFVLVAAAILAFCVATSVLLSSEGYIDERMEQLGSADATVWVSGVDDVDGLAADIAAMPDVASARVTNLIFAGYATEGHHSDDEGQLIAFDADTLPYTFLSDDLTAHVPAPVIEPGEVYVSPALVEGFDVQVGDEVRFELERTGAPQTFVVAGFFEDPLMGSSMIDMKSFLVSPADYADIQARLQEASSLNVLGREGALIQVAQESSAALSPLAFDRVLGQNDQLAQVLEFSYSRDALQSFMVLQQRVLAGFLALFAVALALVAFIVAGHALASAIELERSDLAALKTIGFTSTVLRLVQLGQYALGVGAGLVVGGVAGAYASSAALQMLVTSAGVLAPAAFDVRVYGVAALVVLATLAVVVWVKTRAIVSIRPVEAFEAGHQRTASVAHTPLGGARTLSLSLALRSIATGKARYAAVFSIAVLLVFFVSAVGRIDAWVGPHGEGLMDAFSAADHDVGVQPLNPVDMQAVEQAINSRDEIVGVYALAMQPVRVEGAAYTANVIDAPERFHILEGRTCAAADEIVLTSMAARDLGRSVGDEVEVAEAGTSQRYRVVGIYQCANEMGANIGMSLEGYARIGDIRGYVWCYHYLLADGSHNEEILANLQASFGAAAALHTNSWSGLAGLVGTMRVLVLALWGLAVMLVAVSMALCSGTLLLAERQDMAVYKSLGFTSGQLRVSFALRMGMVVAGAAVGGLVLSALCGDAAVSWMLQMFGIGAFRSPLGFVDSVLPAVGIVALAVVFAFAFSHRIKRADPVELFSGVEA